MRVYPHEDGTFEHGHRHRADGCRASGDGAGRRDNAGRGNASRAGRRPPPRPTPPTRDPNTPGYVEAKELPDGTVPPADADGNFIIGPTHNPAPEMTVQEGVPQGTSTTSR